MALSKAKVKQFSAYFFRYYLGLVFFVTLLIFIGPIYLLISFQKTQRLGFYVHVAWSLVYRILGGYWFVLYRQKYPLPKGPFIIISNHKSYLDIFLLYSMFPATPFLFLGKAELKSLPLIGLLFRKFNIPVYRSDSHKAGSSLKRSILALRNGWSLVIFPEGGIPDGLDTQMIPFKEGAFVLAKKLQIPLVPLTFHNNYELYSDPTEKDVLARPGRPIVTMHPPIESAFIASHSLAELTQYAFNLVQEPLINDNRTFKRK